MDKKVTTQIQGIIHSILAWNKAVFITLQVAEGLVKIKMPTSQCNNHKKLYVGDVVRIRGTISKYNSKEDDVLYSVSIGLGNVQKLIGKNKPQNTRLDFSDDFSYVGTIQSVTKTDDEFYQIIFKENADDGDVHTIYMLCDHFEKAMEHYDFRRLQYISGKMCYVSASKYTMELPTSYLKHYATTLKQI